VSSGLVIFIGLVVVIVASAFGGWLWSVLDPPLDFDE